MPRDRLLMLLSDVAEGRHVSPAVALEARSHLPLPTNLSAHLALTRFAASLRALPAPQLRENVLSSTLFVPHSVLHSLHQGAALSTTGTPEVPAGATGAATPCASETARRVRVSR